MELVVNNFRREPPATINVGDAVFAQKFNESLIHQVVVAYLAQARSGTKAQKSRAEVSGGGRKPWRQKGTGRARAGTIRSPLWRGGGRTFAARPQNYQQKLNRKMYRGAMRSILSELIRQDRLFVVNEIDSITAPKTRELLSLLKSLSQLRQEGKKHGSGGLVNVLIVTDVVSENLYLAARNLANVGLIEATAVDPVSLITFDKTLITLGALQRLEERFA